MRTGRLPRPLELKRYYVLLALAAGPSHAYGIYQQAVDDSSQSLYLSLTTLKRLLTRFVAMRQVEVIGHHEAGSIDVPIYRLTVGGQRLLKACSSDLSAAAATASRRLA